MPQFLAFLRTFKMKRATRIWTRPLDSAVSHPVRLLYSAWLYFHCWIVGLVQQWGRDSSTSSRRTPFCSSLSFCYAPSMPTPSTPILPSSSLSRCFSCLFSFLQEVANPSKAKGIEEVHKVLRFQSFFLLFCSGPYPLHHSNQFESFLSRCNFSCCSHSPWVCRPLNKPISLYRLHSLSHCLFLSRSLLPPIQVDGMAGISCFSAWGVWWSTWSWTSWYEMNYFLCRVQDSSPRSRDPSHLESTE